MKFLCISCDEQMKLLNTVPPEEGAGISVIYGCARCGARVGMLTNPWETQVVSSLGVRIGGKTVDEAGASGEDPLKGCPFGEVVRQMGTQPHRDEGPVWTPAASTRLGNIPEFIRPMARQGIEQYAKSHGYERIDEEVLDEAKDAFGM